MKYTTVDRVLSKIDRDIKGNFQEADLIEWIGDSLGFLETNTVLETKVKVLHVKNYEVEVPPFFKDVIQIVRDNKEERENIQEITTCNECSSPYTFYEDYHVPLIFSDPFCEKNSLSPVRKANGSFFNKLKNSDFNEYTVVGNVCQKLRFSFRDGVIILAYLRNYIDEETGYPYIPDTSFHVEAITYYIKWKLLENKIFNGDRNYLNVAADFERKWLHYAKQANNYSKMPKTIDDYQDLMNSSVHLILDRRKYYRYFNNYKNGQYK